MRNINIEESTPFQLVGWAERLLESGSREDAEKAEAYITESGLCDPDLEAFQKAWAIQSLAKVMMKSPKDIGLEDIRPDEKYVSYKDRAERLLNKAAMLRKNEALHF